MDVFVGMPVGVSVDLFMDVSVGVSVGVLQYDTQVSTYSTYIRCLVRRTSCTCMYGHTRLYLCERD